MIGARTKQSAEGAKTPLWCEESSASVYWNDDLTDIASDAAAITAEYDSDDDSQQVIVNQRCNLIIQYLDKRHDRGDDDDEADDSEFEQLKYRATGSMYNPLAAEKVIA